MVKKEITNKQIVLAVSTLLLLVIVVAGLHDHAQSQYKKGYSSGESEGYDMGRDEGYSEGRSDGYDEGHDDGYSEGIMNSNYESW